MLDGLSWSKVIPERRLHEILPVFFSNLWHLHTCTQVSILCILVFYNLL